MIRPPAVAGQFYPGTSSEIDADLDRLIRLEAARRKAIAVVCPHAGWMYSGPTAGVVYSNIEIPDRVILIGPNHHGIGSQYAVFSAGTCFEYDLRQGYCSEELTP